MDFEGPPASVLVEKLHSLHVNSLVLTETSTVELADPLKMVPLSVEPEQELSTCPSVELILAVVPCCRLQSVEVLAHL